MNNTPKRLLILSGNIIYAQHVGGVGMHVHRLLKKLVEPEVQDYDTSDYKAEDFATQLRKIKSSDVIHLHVSNPYMRLMYALTTKLMGKKSILTVHGNYGRFNGLKNFVDKLAMIIYDVPVLINRESYEKVHDFNKKAVFIPAFILPIEGEEHLDSEVEEAILELKSNKKPLFATSCNRRAFTDDGKEIYGIDFLVNYFTSHPEYNLVVLDPFSDYKPIYEGILPANIKLFSGSYSFCGVMKLADYVIRDTPTDGDAFSVKEALWLHKPTIVSDAVSRPEGVFLFKYNDEITFENAIQAAIKCKEEINLKEEDGIAGYRRLYKNLGIIR